MTDARNRESRVIPEMPKPSRQVTGSTPDPESIPWLPLTKTSHIGDGVMKNVSSIQRLQTKGGKAPAKGCEPSHIGEQARISYAADYYFYASQE